MICICNCTFCLTHKMQVLMKLVSQFISHDCKNKLSGFAYLLAQAGHNIARYLQTLPLRKILFTLVETPIVVS